MAETPPDIRERLAFGWAAGQTVAELQNKTGLSRQSVLTGLAAAGIDPKAWRERNRALGKSLGPVSALKGKVEALCAGYLNGESLADLADRHRTSRSSVRRALLQGGVVLRSRGRPVKQANPL